MFSNSLTDSEFPSLLSLMPNLKYYHEYMYFLNPSLHDSLERGDATLLSALQEHHLGSQRLKGLRQLQQTHQNISRHITYRSGTFLADHLSCDRITQRSNWRTWILYRATPAFVGEVKPEWLYYGLKLEPVRMKNEKGDFILL